MAQLLIVDDDAVARLVLRHMLERDCHVVVEADGAEGALAHLRGNPSPGVDLIICDYVMPDHNGLDVLDACLELGVGPPNVPFVLLTGELRQDDLRDSRVENVSAYLTKPVSSDELERVVSEHLRGTMATWEPSMPPVPGPRH